MANGGKNLVKILRFQKDKLGEKTALIYKRNGRWLEESWEEWWNTSMEIAGGLLSLGLAPQKQVGILAYTSKEWVEVDIGILMCKDIVVTLYQSLLPNTIKYIIEDGELSALFVEDPLQLEKVIKIWEETPTLQYVIVFYSKKELERSDEKGRWKVDLRDVVPEKYKERVLSLEEFLEKGKDYLKKESQTLEKLIDSIDSDEIARIIYTSGTTGELKGAMLTHKNFIWPVERLDEIFSFTEDDLHLLFLPLAHVYAQTVYTVSIYYGIRTAFAESILKVVDNCSEVRPTFFASVPRLYEKIYSTILTTVKKSGGVKEAIFNWALRVGQAHSKFIQRREEPPFPLKLQFSLADKLVYSKLKEKLGGRIRFMISGGAPLSKEIQEFFHAADLLILEGFGMTEVVPPTNVNRPYNYKFGTVGLPIPGQEVKIAEDGEILFRGGNVMKGYWKKEKETKETIDSEGWLHSGDIGEIDKDGFLKITDRKKEIIITSSGKNIPPQPIENRLKEHPLISQAVIIGNGRKYITALVTLDEEAVVNWASLNNIKFTSIKEIKEEPCLKEEIDKLFAKVNSELESFQQIKQYRILDSDFIIGEELTPTLKVKRRVVEEKYKGIIESMYEEGRELEV